jgi:cytochrome c5
VRNLYTFTRLVLAATVVVFTMGHGDEGCCSEEEEILGPETGATCPQGSTLTYQNFGQEFMTTYCTRCHSSTLTGAARMGAPAFHDFDTLEGIKGVSNHVDQTAGSGPEATNEAMPPSGGMPTLAERQMLSEWIACGTP